MSPKTPAIPATTSVPPPGKKLRLAQFDYAWKWFVFHADQREKMFNFMLVALGLFANAIVLSIDKGLPDVAFVLCAASGIVAFIFSRIDFRNEKLVNIGEDVLKELEKGWLFKDQTTKIGVTSTDKGHLHAILQRKADDDGPSPSYYVAGLFPGLKAGKHRICLRAIAWIMVSLFLAGAAYAILCRKNIKSRIPLRDTAAVAAQEQ